MMLKLQNIDNIILIMYTPDRLKPVLDTFSFPARVWVAYSGGLDSHVLLHSLASLRADYPQMQLFAVHVDHGLSIDAASWGEHCQDVCRGLGVKCRVEKIDTAVYGGKLPSEEVTREARYQLLGQVVCAGDYVLMAHHRDDQAETVLLRLLRGAGPAGLSGMATGRALGQGSLVRPLLDIPRAALADYAIREQLVWIEDKSNASTQFTRNFLRHEVLPLLQTRWPGVSRVLARTAQHCREAQQLADILAQQDILQVQGVAANTLSACALNTLSRVRQKNVLRYWFKQMHCPVPSSQLLTHILHDGLTLREDAQPLLIWQGIELRRFLGDIYVNPTLALHDISQVIPWDVQNPCLLPSGLGSVVAVEVNNGLGLKISTDAKVTLRFRQGGERFHAAGRLGSHPLKKLFQEWRVPPWERDRVPLLYIDEILVAVVGYAISANYQVLADGAGRVIQFSVVKQKNIG